MTFTALRVSLRRILREAGERTGLPIDDVYEADEILRHYSGMDRARVLLNGNTEADGALCSACLSAAEERKTGEPLAYLLGEVSFFGLDLAVRRGCLIPRADTEVLVEEIISRIPENGVLWDLCTGTGCIPCAVLTARPDVSAYGAELFDAPLAAAEENRVRLGLEARFSVSRCDVLKGEAPSRVPPSVISANPPYIASSVCDLLDVQVKKEPVSALDGGEDGLLFYRAILSRYAGYLPENGDGYFLFEIGYDQGDALRSLGRAHGFSVSVRRDYAGQDRCAILSRGERFPV